jgi:nucleotide-binding universal stress UspA family protein
MLMPDKRGLSRVVVGFDGSAHARRALAWLARVRPWPGAQALVVSVIDPVRVPSMGMLPESVRGALAGEARKLRDEAQRKARRAAEAAARPLAGTGWQPRVEVREGVPVTELLRTAREARADLVVVGARGTTGVRRLLLGSVSAGVLKDCPVPVVVVR